jgi:hypothetical protein
VNQSRIGTSITGGGALKSSKDGKGNISEIEKFAAEFVELENDHSKRAKQEEDDEEEMEDNLPREAVSSITTPHSSLGTAETGPSLAAPYSFADAEPLA